PAGHAFVHWLATTLAPLTGDPDELVGPSEPDGGAGHAAGTGSLRKASGLVTRPLRDLGGAIVFVPETGRLHWLNFAALLLLELADGRTATEVERAYVASVPSPAPGETGLQVERALRQLRGARMLAG